MPNGWRYNRHEESRVTQLDGSEGARAAGAFAAARSAFMAYMEVNGLTGAKSADLLSNLCEVARRADDVALVERLRSYEIDLDERDVVCSIRHCLDTGADLERSLGKAVGRRLPAAVPASPDMRDLVHCLLTCIFGYAVCRAASFGAAPTWPMLDRAFSEVGEHPSREAALAAWEEVAKAKALHMPFIEGLRELFGRDDIDAVWDQARLVLPRVTRRNGVANDAAP